MKVFPAIDLRGGRCVRLYKGDFGQETVYDEDPVNLAQRYADAGATRIHVVDLDGARDGSFQNLQAIGRMTRAVRCPIQAGGGVRSNDDLHRLFEAGVERAVVGSTAIKDPARVRDWFGRYGAPRVCIAMDVRLADGDYRLASGGWTKTHAMTLWQGIDEFIDDGLTDVLCTDIGRDGTLSGANVDLYRLMVQRYPNLRIQASGGVSDQASLVELVGTGCSAVVVGRALLDGRVKLEDVVPCLRAA